ncbi:MAG: serine/threonine-protein kinase, partial [Planctomycetota bacterium]
MSEQSAKHVSDKPKRTEDPQESIVQRIGRLYGAQTRVMVHDSPSESGPLLPKTDATEGPEDDSQYQILGFIAKGGVGEIYKARDKNLGREVALKVLRADRTETKHIAERLVEEAQVGSQLAHPGVVPVYGLGLQKDGRPHFAMKLIKGATLATLLQDRSAPGENRPELLSHFEQLCHTMAYCHARGVIHRDLKPANIMVGAFGEVLVVDWGFGKVLGLDARGRKKRPAEPTRNPVSVIATLRTTEEGSHSLAGSIMGTPAYMPPEQALGQVDELDERTDVFALGAVLCEILTGQPPYVGEPADVLVLAAQGRLDDAFARLDDCDADSALVELTKESLASVRAERPRHAGVVVERLLAHFAALDERARRAKVEAAKAHTVAEEQRARLEAERLQAEKERAKATEERIKGERALAAAEEQRRLNRWERQRQRRTILLAASILLALLVGGVSYLTVTSAERQRSEEQHAAFSKALSDAMELAGSQRWSEAAAAAEGAIPLIGPEQQHMRADVEGRIKTWRRNQARIEAEAAQVAKDRETLERIRELRASGAGRFDPAERDSAYAAAYREYGIEVERLEPKRAAAAIRDSMIAVELATALDDWVDLRRTAPALGDRDWKRLAEIAQEADPDPTRSRIRDELSRK